MVLVFERRELPFDEQILHLSGQFQGVAVGDDHVGDLALLEGAELASQSKNLRRIHRDRAQRFFVGQAVRDGVRSILSQAPRERVVKAGDGNLHAGSRQLGGLGELAVVRIVFFRGKREHGTKNDGDLLRPKKVLHFVSFLASREDHF